MLLTKEIKNAHMTELAAYKKKLWKQPKLRNLFLELTMNCSFVSQAENRFCVRSFLRLWAMLTSLGFIGE